MQFTDSLISTLQVRIAQTKHKCQEQGLELGGIALSERFYLAVKADIINEFQDESCTAAIAPDSMPKPVANIYLAGIPVFLHHGQEDFVPLYKGLK